MLSPSTPLSHCLHLLPQNLLLQTPRHLTWSLLLLLQLLLHLSLLPCLLLCLCRWPPSLAPRRRAVARRAERVRPAAAS